MDLDYAQRGSTRELPSLWRHQTTIKPKHDNEAVYKCASIQLKSKRKLICHCCPTHSSSRACHAVSSQAAAL